MAQIEYKVLQYPEGITQKTEKERKPCQVIHTRDQRNNRW